MNAVYFAILMGTMYHVGNMIVDKDTSTMRFFGWVWIIAAAIFLVMA